MLTKYYFTFRCVAQSTSKHRAKLLSLQILGHSNLPVNKIHHSLSKSWTWTPYCLFQQSDPLPSQEAGSEGLFSCSDMYSATAGVGLGEDTPLIFTYSAKVSQDSSSHSCVRHFYFKANRYKTVSPQIILTLDFSSCQLNCFLAIIKLRHCSLLTPFSLSHFQIWSNPANKFCAISDAPSSNHSSERSSHYIPLASGWNLCFPNHCGCVT